MIGEDSRLARYGTVGLVVTAAISMSALQFDQLPFLRSGAEYTAYFVDAGGLMPGDTVQVAGVRSGKVEQIKLAGANVLVKFSLDESIPLGNQTTAAIKADTMLGRKSLDVVPGGTGELLRDDTIPLARTMAPYSLTDALGDLTNDVQGMDTDKVNQTLDALSGAFADTPAPLRSALDGVTALSKSLNTRDKALLDLLSHAQNVTKVLADRSDQLNALINDGDSLLGELANRRAAISQLISAVGELAKQLSGFVTDNETQLKPDLDQLNQLLGLLQKNKDNLGKALDGAGPFAAALGEEVGSGPYFQAYVSNATSVGLRPLVDSLVWPEHVPDSFRDYITSPPPSVGPMIQEPPR